MEQRPAIQIRSPGHMLAVLSDFEPVRELPRRSKLHPLKQRQVAQRIVVTRQPWVAVPIPAAAKVTRLLDNEDAVHVRLSKVLAAQNTSPLALSQRDIALLHETAKATLREKACT